MGDFDYAAAVERGIRNERVFEFLPYLVDMLAAEAFLFLGSLHGDDLALIQLLDETTVSVGARALDGGALAIPRFKTFYEQFEQTRLDVVELQSAVSQE